MTLGRTIPSASPERLARMSLAFLLLAPLLLAASFLLAACGGGQAAAPSGSPSITGIVTSSTAGDDGSAVASFLVTQGTGDYDKAHVNVVAETAWYRTNGGKVEPIETPVADALLGKRVQVRFAGAVAESYPVQATAEWVIVQE